MGFQRPSYGQTAGRRGEHCRERADVSRRAAHAVGWLYRLFMLRFGKNGIRQEGPAESHLLIFEQALPQRPVKRLGSLGFPQMIKTPSPRSGTLSGSAFPRPLTRYYQSCLRLPQRLHTNVPGLLTLNL